MSMTLQLWGWYHCVTTAVNDARNSKMHNFCSTSPLLCLFTGRKFRAVDSSCKLNTISIVTRRRSVGVEFCFITLLVILCLLYPESLFLRRHGIVHLWCVLRKLSKCKVWIQFLKGETHSVLIKKVRTEVALWCILISGSLTCAPLVILFTRIIKSITFGIIPYNFDLINFIMNWNLQHET